MISSTMLDSINLKIGLNIRRARTLRGMSQADLAQRMTDICGKKFSTQQISQWETGDANVSAATLEIVAEAIGCTEYALHHTKSEHTDFDVRAQTILRGLTSHQREVLHYLVSEWDGDWGAALENIAAYATMKSLEARAESSGINITIYKQEHAAGRTDPRCEPDIAYLDKGHRRIERLSLTQDV